MFFDVHTLVSERDHHNRLSDSLVLDLVVASSQPCRVPDLLVVQNLVLTVKVKEFPLSRPSRLLGQSFPDPPWKVGLVQAWDQEADHSHHNHLSVVDNHLFPSYRETYLLFLCHSSQAVVVHAFQVAHRASYLLLVDSLLSQASEGSLHGLCRSMALAVGHQTYLME